MGNISFDSGVLGTDILGKRWYGPKGLKLTISIVLHNSVRRGFVTSACKRSEDIFAHRDTAHNNPSTAFDFSPDNLERIARLRENYPIGAQRSLVTVCLDIAQRQIGWVPISAMHKIAEILDMPRMRVYEVATFYTMFKRKSRGKYHVKVCVTTPCMLRGSDDILKAVENATCCPIGEVSKDGMFGVDSVQCAGACVNAPILVVDDDYYEDVTAEDVKNIIFKIKNGKIPLVGPQSGRTCCEPICGLTTLHDPPPKPGFGMQKGLC